MKKQFSADLLEKHILPVQIIIENRSSGYSPIFFDAGRTGFRERSVQRAMSEGEMGRLTEQNMTAPYWIYVGHSWVWCSYFCRIGSDIENKIYRPVRRARNNTMSSVIIDSQKMMCGFLFLPKPCGYKSRIYSKFCYSTFAER